MHPGFAHKCFNRLIIPKGFCSLLFVCFFAEFQNVIQQFNVVIIYSSIKCSEEGRQNGFS